MGVGVRRVEVEGNRDAGRAADERDEGEGHIGIIGVPCPVAGLVGSASPEQAVSTADEDENGAYGGRDDVEDHLFAMLDRITLNVAFEENSLLLLRLG
ncbi:hypothetical protein ColKHC_08713 [Colletotrichum higginsianum]|nr:hypothetical protein ColKHC_08713 [Colletotrichum higginsianum]